MCIRDRSKDQSYVLGVLSADQLRRTLLPLGADLKEDVRAEAASRGLLVARKPDSHDICFIPDGDTAGFLRRTLGEQPGDIVDAGSGAVVAGHDGSYAFTIGQRRGLNLRTPADDGSPRYVIDVDVQTRVVTVGAADLLDVDAVEGIRPIWAGPALDDLPRELSVQVRAHGAPVPCTAALVDGRVASDAVDPRVGFSQVQPLGTALQAGDALLRVHAATLADAEAARAAVLAAVTLADTAPPHGPVVIDTL